MNGPIRGVIPFLGLLEKSIGYEHLICRLGRQCVSTQHMGVKEVL
jgi:hypothetical protein